MSDNTSLADAISSYPVHLAANSSPPTTMKDALIEIQSLRERIEALEEERDNTADNITILFGLIKKLKDVVSPEPRPLQASGGEILRALLAQNNGKMLESDARKRMGLSKQAFTNLLATMRDYIITKPYHLDRRKNVIILK